MSSTPEGPKPGISPRFANDLERFSEALALIARAVPERTSIRQVLALTLVALANSQGRPITLTDLLQLGGDDVRGNPVLGVSIERSLDTFRVPRRKQPDALGWVDSTEDDEDRRRKYLHMTPLGVSRLTSIIDTLKGGTE